MTLFGRFTAWSSQLANKRGIYLGRRATKIHVALYRRTGGRIGGHLPGWKGVPSSSWTTRGRGAAGGAPLR